MVFRRTKFKDRFDIIMETYNQEFLNFVLVLPFFQKIFACIVFFMLITDKIFNSRL